MKVVWQCLGGYEKIMTVWGCAMRWTGESVGGEWATATSHHKGQPEEGE